MKKCAEINKTLNLSHVMGSCSVLWRRYEYYGSYQKHDISSRVIFIDPIYDRAFGQGLKKKRSRPKLVAGIGQKIVSKTLRFRAYPTRDQMILIWKTFGCERFVWNHLLAEKIDHYEKTGKKLTNTPAHLKKLFPFLKEPDCQALCNIQVDLEKSWNATTAKGKFPDFWKKGDGHRSYTTNWINNNIRILQNKNVKGKEAGAIETYLLLPKLGLVRINCHRDIPTGWQIKNVTVKETASGKFFVSIGFDAVIDIPKPVMKFEKVEALDYSSSNLMVSHSGQFDVLKEEIAWYRDLEKKIASEQRKLSRMVKGSKNYYKQLHKIGKLHEKAANRRKDFLHKLSCRMANTFDAVVLEDINLREMARKLTAEEKEMLVKLGLIPLQLGKATMDNGFGMFRTFLAYKMKDRGKVVVKVDKYFPSTQLCSSCGYKNPALKDVSIREWTCPECGERHDRDKNACKNLLDEGIRLLNRWTSGDSSLLLNPQGFLSEKKPHLQKDGE